MVANLVNPGNSVADIGTDHGYLPIYLVKERISPKVIAMDVRKGPLSKAKEHVFEHNMMDTIELRLSDGLEMLQYGETDTITICGMGGRLMKQILSNGKELLKDGIQLILSPQSELAEFRIYLKNNNIHIINEVMLKEDNQYYVIMDCRYDELKQMAEDQFGKKLLEHRDPVLKEFLHRELKLTNRIMEKLEQLEMTEGVKERMEILHKDKNVILTALKYFS